eukprot:5863065-Pyramimonas_sp.AAC.1
MLEQVLRKVQARSPCLSKCQERLERESAILRKIVRNYPARAVGVVVVARTQEHTSNGTFPLDENTGFKSRRGHFVRKTTMPTRQGGSTMIVVQN